LKNLSDREQQILGLAAAGLLDKQISHELGLSLNTLRTYWTRIRQKGGNLPRAALTVSFVQGQLATKGTAKVSGGHNIDLADTTNSVILHQSAIYYATVMARLNATIRKAERAGRVLAGYPAVVGSLSTEQKLLDDVGRLLVEVGGYVMAWFGWVVHDPKKTIEIVSEYGDRFGYLDGIELHWADVPTGRGPAGRAVRSNQTQVNQDFLADDAMLPWRERAIKSGFQSSAGFPLSSNEEVFGVFNVYAEEPDAFQDLELRLLEDIGRDLSFRIAQIREGSGPKM
jgi:DNA-binding CsgD family transcriptional regulator/GAF domain-containing protein